MQFPSIVDIREPELISQLLADPVWRNRLVEVHGIPDDSAIFSEVLLAGLPGAPKGDIDILLIPPTRPDFATGIQVKRVKVSESAFYTEGVNKLGKVSRGRQQANLIAQIGFAQVYYFVIVVIDSRTIKTDPMNFNGLTPALQHKINAVITTDGLDDRVGLIHHEIFQSMDGHPLGAGGGGAELKRGAKVGVQPREVTEWVRGIVANRPAK